MELGRHLWLGYSTCEGPPLRRSFSLFPSVKLHRLEQPWRRASLHEQSAQDSCVLEDSCLQLSWFLTLQGSVGQYQHKRTLSHYATPAVKNSVFFSFFLYLWVSPFHLCFRKKETHEILTSSLGDRGRCSVGHQYTQSVASSSSQPVPRLLGFSAHTPWLTGVQLVRSQSPR